MGTGLPLGALPKCPPAMASVEKKDATLGEGRRKMEREKLMRKQSQETPQYTGCGIRITPAIPCNFGRLAAWKELDETDQTDERILCISR